MFLLDRPLKIPRRAIECLYILIGALVALVVAMVNAPRVGAADYDYIGVFGAFSANQPTADGNVLAGNRLVDILEKTPDGRRVTWRNPKTGIAYQIHVLTTVVSGTENCRTFTIRRTADEDVRESHRTACRLAHGIWKINAYPATDEESPTNAKPLKGD